jgi:hypothetical protein
MAMNHGNLTPDQEKLKRLRLRKRNCRDQLIDLSYDADKARNLLENLDRINREIKQLERGTW